MSNRFERETERAGYSSTNMMRLLGQMLMLPFTVFIYGMEAFVKTIQGVQQAADEGMDVVAGKTTQTPGEAPGSQSELKDSTASSVTDNVINDDAETTLKEAIDVNDKDLSDGDMLKLVRYKILFIKRDYEVAFREVEELVSDDIDETGYTAWKVAEFIQSLAKRKTEVPDKWGSKYPSDKKDSHGRPLYRDGNILLGFPEEDKKYLRVYFEVLERYQREKFRHDQRQIEVLEEIRDRL
jgi:hypothetical protein